MPDSFMQPARHVHLSRPFVALHHEKNKPMAHRLWFTLCLRSQSLLHLSSTSVWKPGDQSFLSFPLIWLSISVSNSSSFSLSRMRWVAEDEGFVCLVWKVALIRLCLLWLKQVKFVKHQTHKKVSMVVIMAYNTVKELFSQDRESSGESQTHRPAKPVRIYSLFTVMGLKLIEFYVYILCNK